MKEKRWAAEVDIMRNHFPDFRLFRTEEGLIGFDGALRGRTGAIYTVRIAIRESSYPYRVPQAFISPKVGPYIEPDGALSLICPWQPDKSAFALVTLCAMQYLWTYDGANDFTSTKGEMP